MTFTITIGAKRTPTGIQFGVHLEFGDTWIGVYKTVAQARLERDLLALQAVSR